MTEQFPPSFRGKRPEILILDVDGVLTDNRIAIHGGAATDSKQFFVPDGVGLKLLQRVGVRCAWISGRASAATHQRAEELGMEWHLTGIHRKGPEVARILTELGLDREQAVFVGDDLIDLPAFQEVGLSVAVANAHPLVRKAATAVTTRRGGEGAVREVCEWILAARGEWDQIVKEFAP